MKKLWCSMNPFCKEKDKVEFNAALVDQHIAGGFAKASRPVAPTS